MTKEDKKEDIKVAQASIDIDVLSPKGKLHAEQYQKLQLQRVVHQLEIEKIDVLMKYYEQTIPKEIKEGEPPKDDK